MKYSDSQTTNQTKTSLLKSQAPNSITPPSLTVFMHYQFRLISVFLTSEGETVEELTIRSLSNFARLCELEVDEHQKWNLYACRKTGQVYSDFPSLDPAQKVDKTKVKYFYLSCMN